jgi:hypothetical protein
LLCPPPDDVALPPLDDLRRFPSVSVAIEQRQRWADYRLWLGRAQPLWTEQLHEIDVWMVRADLAAQAWDALTDARLDGTSEGYRRRRLAELRDRLRPWNYDAGRMPPLLHARPARSGD